MLYYARGNARDTLGEDDLRKGLFETLDRLGPRRRVLAVPPDITRLHSRAGELTRFAHEYYGERLAAVLPAIGTHEPVSAEHIRRMFPGVPADRFRVHDWRGGLVTLGEVPASVIREVSEGRLDLPWPVSLDRLLVEGGFDLILSLGQVVPHEVAGMAGYTKNLLIGTGGRETIHRSHYLGAVIGMERIMGRADNPVRQVFDQGARFLAGLPIVHALTVVSPDAAGDSACRGLFTGDDRECYTRAAALAREANVTLLDRPMRKAVVWLDPHEYRSTWLGNKAIYRTRMALADGGELVVLAPGLREFGEDREIDRLIRRYGYVGTPQVLERVREEPELQASLGTAAHLIHGSAEGRFTVTYCPGNLSREEIEGVGYRWADLAQMVHRYDPARLREGLNRLPDGEEVWFISHPGLGLWAVRERFET